MKVDIQVTGLQSWVAQEREKWTEAEKGCSTTAALQSVFSAAGDVEVLSCIWNGSGSFELEDERLMHFPGTVCKQLPPYYDVRIRHRTGRHTEYIVLWLPQQWNGRYLGTGGGGYRADNCWGADLPNMRMASIPTGLRNGFAVSSTNAGVDDAWDSEWALDKETGDTDRELIANFAVESVHSMVVISKKIIKAVYGTAPEYSYMQGMSTGGRQSMAEAQRYPEDFDGIWADCPSINWTRFVPALLWPRLVMKEEGNVLPPEKLEAFRKAAVKRNGGIDAYYQQTERLDFRAKEAVGMKTAAGKITAEDAEVMQKIWDGPHTENGEFLWYGIRPGVESWSNETHLLYSVDGELLPYSMTDIHFGRWLLKDPDWDWTTLTRKEYEALFRRSVEELEEMATDNADLQGFHQTGGKLLISHGLDDEVVFPDGTIRYYGQVLEKMGGQEKTDSFIRLFLFPGNGHGYSKGNVGFSLADGMAALMEWVENGNAPEEVKAHCIDSETFEVTGEGLLFPYRAEDRKENIG